MATNVSRGHVQLLNVSVHYGGRAAVNNVSLDIAPGEFVCLLGPSGCGKTTTLRAIAGLAAVDSGEIRIDGTLANHLHAHRRGIAMVFQDLALFPHMTVRENIAFGLALRRADASEMRDKIAAMVRLLHLEGLEGRLPRQLSGGQQQRVAIARSLVVNPSVLLLDEPFAALDRKLREDMRREIRALQRRLGITVVFVTHDQEEALTMADRVVVMNHGVIEQAGTPSDIYETPASRFVMNFVGFSNFLAVDSVTREGTAYRCRAIGRDIVVATPAIRGERPDTRPELALRPERIRVATGAPTLANRVAGSIQDIAYEGAAITYEVGLDSGGTLVAREQNLGQATVHRRIGDRVTLEWSEADAVLIGGVPSRETQA